MSQLDIRIGTLAQADKGAAYLQEILPHGFESFQLTFWQEIGDIDLKELAKQVRGVIGGKAVISSLGMFGNPLQDEDRGARLRTLHQGGAACFDCNIVAGFAGVIEGVPMPESMPAVQEGVGQEKLAKVAEDSGVRIAWENCDMGGTWESPKWNMAHSPKAWEMMFDALPSDALGLEWEPCHQMNSLIDPLPQLRKWIDKVYHVHGKDATVAWDVVRESRHPRRQTIRVAPHARLRRHQLDRRDFDSAHGRLQRLDRYRRLARPGL